eukprot:249715_1
MLLIALSVFTVFTGNCVNFVNLEKYVQWQKQGIQSLKNAQGVELQQRINYVDRMAFHIGNEIQKLKASDIDENERVNLAGVVIPQHILPVKPVLKSKLLANSIAQKRAELQTDWTKHQQKYKGKAGLTNIDQNNQNKEYVRLKTLYKHIQDLDSEHAALVTDERLEKLRQAKF